MVTYPALFEPDTDAGGYVVTFPDFGWGVTQGENEQEAMEMAADLLFILVAEQMKTDADLPKPSKRRGAKYRFLSLPGLASAKAELYSAFRRCGITKAELARRIGIPRTNVDRLFDLGHASRLDQIEAAFGALGKRLVIAIQDAA